MLNRKGRFGVVRNLLRTTIALVMLLEGVAFIAGAGLHLGLSLPGPFVESKSLPTALLEAGSGALLLIVVVAIAARYRRAWEIAIAAHVAGVTTIAFGIATRGSSLASQVSHHPPMLLITMAALVALATPPCRSALESGRRRRNRHRVLQSL
jgi:hypothetical protein